jgi:hypothetical protein
MGDGRVNMHMKCLLRVGMTGLLAAVLWAGAAQADTERLTQVAPRYDEEYPVIAYSGRATHNRVWRLQQRLDSGALKLEWEPRYGYLRAVLKALQIDADSQVMVFSKTSLQVDGISDVTPRAIYFNEDTYVGYVQGSPLLELVVIDDEKGVVFFGLENVQAAAQRFEREGGRCLTCHDTYSMMGGGVPRVLAMSSPVEDPADTRAFTSAADVDDRTPIAQRWGGWYVTGDTGRQKHFGNLPLREERGGAELRRLQSTRLNRLSLQGYFDTSAYLNDGSDVVALMVLEHQTLVQNLITRVNYKVRTVLSREGQQKTETLRSWADVNPRDQSLVRVMMEPLVRALFFQEAAPFEDRIKGGSGFAARFSASGPRDARGRGLYELDLNKRLFRYPMSFLVYSTHFDALPRYALDYIETRIVEVLQGRDTTGIAARIAPADREAIRQILIDTKPSLAKLLQAAGPTASR